MPNYDIVATRQSLDERALARSCNAHESDYNLWHMGCRICSPCFRRHLQWSTAFEMFEHSEQGSTYRRSDGNVAGRASWQLIIAKSELTWSRLHQNSDSQRPLWAFFQCHVKRAEELSLEKILDRWPKSRKLFLWTNRGRLPCGGSPHWIWETWILKPWRLFCRYEFRYFFPMHDRHALGLIRVVIHQSRWLCTISFGKLTTIYAKAG